MDLSFVVNLIRGAVFQTVIMAAPILLIAMVIGLIISIFQATTSIQDQTLTFVPKIIAILIALGLLGGWIITRMTNYTINLFSLISQMTG